MKRREPEYSLDATDPAVRIRDEEMRKRGVGQEIFARNGRATFTNPLGSLSRDPYLTQKRAEVFAAMKARNLSYPEIARVCGFVGHSGILETLRKFKAKPKEEVIQEPVAP